MPADSKDGKDELTQDQTSPADTLRQARKASGLSVDEVAHRLHLSREVVLALEAGEFDVLGAPVFVKGHLRSYARLLELPEEDVINSVQQYEPEPEEFRTLSMQSEVKPAASLSNFVLLVMFGVIVLVGTVYLFIGDDETAVEDDFEEAAAAELEMEAPATAVDESSDFAAETVVAEAPPEPDGVVIATEKPVAPEAELEPEPQPAVSPAAIAPAAVAVTFRFRDECWVEVADSRRRVLYGLKKAGAESNFMGVPPFKIFLGNAAAVELEIGGETFSIPRGRRGGKTARFTISEGDLQ